MFIPNLKKMKFTRIIPSDALKPYIKYLVISENASENTYKVFPSTGLVIGFQYRGRLNVVVKNNEISLSSAGITGMMDTYRIFKNSSDIGTVLVYLTETALAHFTALPANELFNHSVSLDHLFDKDKIASTEERLSNARTDKQRIRIVEHFFLSHLKKTESDRLIVQAVRMIYESRGTIKIGELHKQLHISQSPFEKRFRKLVGTTPKKFSSIVRFNAVLNQLRDGKSGKSLTDICHEHDFFDQAHFIKDFAQHTGETPERFKGFL